MRAQEFVEAYIKQAVAELPRAPSLSDSRVTKKSLPKYTAPVPATQTTQPQLAAPQKNIEPPTL